MTFKIPFYYSIKNQVFEPFDIHEPENPSRAITVETCPVDVSTIVSEPALLNVILLVAEFAPVSLNNIWILPTDEAGRSIVGDTEVVSNKRNPSPDKIAVGEELYKELNIDKMFGQKDDIDAVANVAEILGTHPYLINRIHALKDFYGSEIYRKYSQI